MMMRQLIQTIAVILLTANLFAQEPIGDMDKQRAIERLSQILENRYVFPEKGIEMSRLLHSNLTNGIYSTHSSAANFAAALTADIQKVTGDKHLNVNYRPLPPSDSDQQDSQPPMGPSPEMLDQMRRDNYGFQEVKILEGNVGYIDLRGFFSTVHGGDVASAAMNFLSGADAIIFDLRRNGGGSPAMIQLLTSYLYPAHQNVHLNSFYYRPQDETTQTWTLPHVPGKRNPDAKVFVLTSGFTFSAAEEFTYNLKNLERATIVGETTGGGAHPGGTVRIDENFICFVPTGRAINPITKTNWEGTGVEPDVKVAAEDALEKAHALALEQLEENAEDDNDKAFYRWYKEIIEARAEPIRLTEHEMKKCAGIYSFRTILYEAGKLFYQRDGRPKLALIPLGKNAFMPEGIPDFRLTVEFDDDEAVALIATDLQGLKERLERSTIKP